MRRAEEMGVESRRGRRIKGIGRKRVEENQEREEDKGE